MSLPQTSLVVPAERPRHGFEVFELRRYTIKPGQRQNFARYFETYFPEAFQQEGSLVAGQFFERNRDDGFTWIRAFRNMNEQAIVNAKFYFGPVWKEHRTRMNELLVDSDDVLLLQPLTDRGILDFSAIDVVREPDGASGIVVAQIFPMNETSGEDLASNLRTLFDSYQAAGARELAILATNQNRNNFPQLPVRTDGPYLVWIGIVQNDAALEGRLLTVISRAQEHLSKSHSLSGPPEVAILDPTPRSRMRWLSSL